MARCGTKPPRRTADPAEAVRISARDGIAVLTGLAETDFAVADRLPAALWGGGLTGWLAPAEIRNTGEREVLTLGKENGQAQLTNQHQRGAHTDSFKSHGEEFADFFLLLFAKASRRGGETFAVDGYCTLAALSAHPVTAPLVAAIADQPVLQTNIAVSSGGVVERVAPMCCWGHAPCRADVQPLPVVVSAGRRLGMQICHDTRALHDGASDDQARANEMLYVFRRAVREVEASAPRFRVESNEALIFDNWRVMHGREPYTDLDRQLWRVWCWTDRGARNVPLEARLEQPHGERLLSV
jgi:hypothetical protein